MQCNEKQFNVGANLPNSILQSNEDRTDEEAPSYFISVRSLQKLGVKNDTAIWEPIEETPCAEYSAGFAFFCYSSGG
jgi:hypothetical protein